MTKSVECYYNDCFSLEWCHHEGYYVLRSWYKDGEEGTLVINSDMLEDFIDLGCTMKKQRE